MFSAPGFSQLSPLSLKYPTGAACGGKGFFRLTFGVSVQDWAAPLPWHVMHSGHGGVDV